LQILIAFSPILIKIIALKTKYKKMINKKNAKYLIKLLTSFGKLLSICISALFFIKVLF
jgi:hypothetical protein